MPTLPRLWMWPGMMPILHSPGVITPGQLGPISRDLEPRQRALDLDHVQHRNAFGDADDQRHFRVDRFQDGVGGEGRRDIDRRWRRRRPFRVASRTVSNTGRPRWVEPPLPGVVPPTILVP